MPHRMGMDHFSPEIAQFQVHCQQSNALSQQTPMVGQGSDTTYTYYCCVTSLIHDRTILNSTAVTNSLELN